MCFDNKKKEIQAIVFHQLINPKTKTSPKRELQICDIISRNHFCLIEMIYTFIRTKGRKELCRNCCTIFSTRARDPVINHLKICLEKNLAGKIFETKTQLH